MAVSESELNQGAPAPQHKGPLGFLKRIKPGEWVLIGIGLVGIIAYALWYRGQQSSSGTANALIPASGTSDPAWGTAVAQPGSPFSDELASLLSLLQAQGAVVPPTTIADASGASSGGGTGAVGGVAGGASGTGSAALISPPVGVAAPASSGSGITQQANNQSPVSNISQVVAGTASAIAPAPSTPNTLGLAADTGTVGVPFVNSAAQAVRAPANVAPSLPRSTAQGGRTLGSTPKAPTHAPVNVVTDLGPVTHASAPTPHPSPATKGPTHAPAGVRPA